MKGVVMNAILFEIGPITIYWYTVLVFIAFLLGGTLAINEAKKWKIPEDFMINLFFYLIPICIIGARVYYVLFNLDYYTVNPIAIFKIWEGGLAIHGGIIAGLIFVFIYAKKYKINWVRLLDILVVSLALGQAIGRWGNFFNGEAHGGATTLEALQAWHLPNFIIEGMNIGGTYYVPTFLIESIFCLILFIVLLVIRDNRYTELGQTTCFYLMLYGIERFIVEGFRTDSLMLGNLRIAQLVSVAMVIIGLIVFLRLRKGSIFSNKYNDIKNTNETTF